MSPIRRILVVEDDERCLKLAVDVLTHAGYAVRGCDSAHLACEALDQRWPELVLLDIQLPDVSGQDLLHWIRQQPALASLPVIALTASVSQHERASFARSGFTACLSKPLSLKELRECVSLHLPPARPAVTPMAPMPPSTPTPP